MNNLILMLLVISARAQPTLLRLTSPNITERSRRDPRAGFTRNLDLRIELIDLLQRKALGLVDHEVDEGDTQEAACEPDEEDLGLEVRVAGAKVDEVGGGVGDGEVEEPVGGRGNGETLCADFEREDLAGDDPGDGAPGGGEEEDVDADEGDGGALGVVVERERLSCDWILTAVDGTKRCDDELTDTHSYCSGEEEWSAAKFINGVEAWES